MKNSKMIMMTYVCTLFCIVFRHKKYVYVAYKMYKLMKHMSIKQNFNITLAEVQCFRKEVCQFAHTSEGKMVSANFFS